MTDEVKDYEVGYGKPPKEHTFKPGNKMGGRPLKQDRLQAFKEKNLIALNNGKITPVMFWQNMLDREDASFSDRHKAAVELAKLYLVPEKDIKEAETREETVKSIDDLMNSLQNIKEEMNKK